MDVSLNLWTDGAMLSMFDPALFVGSNPVQAWPHHRNPDVRDGKFVLIGLQGDCTFRLRLTDEPPTERESELTNDTLGPFGLVVVSGRVYVSGMDLPGEELDVFARHGAGGFVELAPGAYNVVIHELDPPAASEPDRRALADFVAVVSRRSGPFGGLKGEACFTGGRAVRRQLDELRSR